jgi:hypothetical protein
MIYPTQTLSSLFLEKMFVGNLCPNSYVSLLMLFLSGLNFDMFILVLNIEFNDTVLLYCAKAISKACIFLLFLLALIIRIWRSEYIVVQVSGWDVLRPDFQQNDSQKACL